MVSFSCEVCNDTVKKPKLDQHAGRCRGAYFTCIDCNTTFEGTSYRAHTSCVSEEQRYHKSVYKAPKGKGKKAQQSQNAAPPAAASTPAQVPAPAPAAVQEALKAEQKKRAREEDAPVKTAGEAARAPMAGDSGAPAPAPIAAAGEASKQDGGADEPAKKKKKSKKAKGDAAESNGTGAAPAAAAAAQANGAGEAKTADGPSSVKAFLSEAVTPLLAGENVSLADVRIKVVEQAKAKGLKVDEVESALWAGLKVGGKKQKVRAEFV